MELQGRTVQLGKREVEDEMDAGGLEKQRQRRSSGVQTCTYDAQEDNKIHDSPDRGNETSLNGDCGN